MQKEIYEDLFVLELANNHWGSLNRGLKIIRDFGDVVRRNNVRAALKLQFRDVASFIHRQHRDRDDVRYIKKVGATELSWDELGVLIQAARDEGLEVAKQRAGLEPDDDGAGARLRFGHVEKLQGAAGMV